jgi:heme/copper-type cytochrome/quinol oxidase subunit 3
MLLPECTMSSMGQEKKEKEKEEEKKKKKKKGTFFWILSDSPTYICFFIFGLNYLGFIKSSLQKLHVPRPRQGQCKICGPFTAYKHIVIFIKI